MYEDNSREEKYSHDSNERNSHSLSKERHHHSKGSGFYYYRNRYAGAALPWPLGMSFLTAVLLVVFALLVVLLITVDSADYMKSSSRKASFGGRVYELLKVNYSSYAAGSGFEPDVLLGQISAERINQDIQQSIDKLYAGDGSINPRENVRDDTYASMMEYAQENGAAITEEVEEAVYLVAEYCRYDYSDYVAIPLASPLSVLVQKLDIVLLPGVIIIGVITLIAIVLTFLLAGGNQIGIRFLAYAFVTATILCCIMAFVIYPLLGLERLNLSPDSIKQLLLCYIRGIFERFGLFAATYGVISAGLIILPATLYQPYRIKKLKTRR